jgi:hypothetical protein
MSRLPPLLLLLVSLVAITAGTTNTTPTNTDHYFRLMRAYLGDKTFSQHPCLVLQERQGGWVLSRDPSASKMPFPFKLGAEGAGHHVVEALFGKDGQVQYSTLERQVAPEDGKGVPHRLESIPAGWRKSSSADLLPLPMSHPDIPSMVKQGRPIIALLRYPPSALLSAVERFSQCSAGKRDGLKWPWDQPPDEARLVRESKSCWRNLTITSDLFVMLDSIATVEASLRYPGLDCNGLLLAPFELITQYPMAFEAPFAQVGRLVGRSVVLWVGWSVAGCCVRLPACLPI